MQYPPQPSVMCRLQSPAVCSPASPVLFFPDCLVWYFIPPRDMQYPPQPSVMCRLQSPAVCYCDWPCLVSTPYSSVLSTIDSYSQTLVSMLQPLLFHILSNLPNTAFALPIRVLISLSQLLSDEKNFALIA